MKKTKMVEIRFEGRGGEGAVTSADLLAKAAFFGGKQAQAFPAFSVERRGAPVQAFCRISDSEKPIRLHQEVYEPDYVIVLDDSLSKSVDVFEGMKKGLALVASKKPPEAFKEMVPSGVVVKTIDAYAIAHKIFGKPLVNTAILGAFARATGLVSLENLEKAVREQFAENKELVEKNVEAVCECYNSC